MTRNILIAAAGVLAGSVGLFAQANPEVEKALLAAPRNQREATTVIKWKADGTYDTLKEGTNSLVCYDQSGQPTEQPVLGAVHQQGQSRAREAEQEVRDGARPRETGRGHRRRREGRHAESSPSSARCSGPSAARTRPPDACT